MKLVKVIFSIEKKKTKKKKKINKSHKMVSESIYKTLRLIYRQEKLRIINFYLKIISSIFFFEYINL